MKPRDLPKYVWIARRGRKTRYYYPLNDAALAERIELDEIYGWKPVRMYRCSYERIKAIP